MSKPPQELALRAGGEGEAILPDIIWDVQYRN